MSRGTPRALVFEEEGGACAICGRTSTKVRDGGGDTWVYGPYKAVVGGILFPRGSGWMVIDHIVPRALGGSDERVNLQVLCDPCNASKGARIVPDLHGRTEPALRSEAERMRRQADKLDALADRLAQTLRGAA